MIANLARETRSVKQIQSAGRKREKDGENERRDKSKFSS